VALALRADGWYLRSDIIWHKPNPMPESVTDRPTKAHEYLFLLSKSERYYYDADAIAEDAAAEPKICGPKNDASRNDGNRVGIVRGNGITRNRRTVWTVATQPFGGAHFATFPPALIEPCILAGSRKGDTVLDPFGGAGTTGLVADRLGRDAILYELNPTYADLARRRITDDAPLFGDVA
jgi:DNA modification methylase